MPLHVTGFWLPVFRRNPLEAGSLGAGLLLEPRVVFTLEEGPECSDSIDAVYPGLVVREGLPRPAVKALEVLGERLHGTIRVTVPVPLGAGYAVSAALALGAAVLAVLTRARGFLEAARAAHVAEVVEGTGLGDVIAVYEGRMLEARTAPGAPGLGRVESFPVDAGYAVTVALGSMETRAVHEELGGRIKQAFSKAYTGFMESPGLDSFLEAAERFSVETGFAGGELREALGRLVSKGYARGWYVKKKVAVIIPEDGYVGEVLEEAKRLRGRVFLHRIAGSPVVARRVA